MPILRHDDVLKGRRNPIDDGHDLGALWDGERAARHEAILHVDDDERAAAVGLDAAIARRHRARGESHTCDARNRGRQRPQYAAPVHDPLNT
jgi:hypothetical protein